MHTDVILTNKRRTHAQSNYTNTKLKARFRRLLHHPARKWSGPILHPRTHKGENRQEKIRESQTNTKTLNNSNNVYIQTRKHNTKKNN